MSSLLRHENPDFRDQVLARGNLHLGALALAASHGHKEVMRALLDFAVENPSYAKSIFAGISKIIRVRMLRSPNVDVHWLLLDFAAANPEFRDLIFESRDNGILRFALYTGNVETVRALLDFAAADSDHADIIIPQAPSIGFLLGRTAQAGNIPVLRAMLESPFWASFLNSNLHLPQDPETARSVWMVLLEYAPYLAGETEQFPNLGLLEDAVMEMDRDRVRTLLGQGVGLESGGELLAAMLWNSRNFEREQMRSFVAILESLRRELLPPEVQARAQTLFEHALLNNPPLEEQAAPQTAQTLDQIIRIIRSRLLPNLQTLSLEAFARGIRNLGQYGGRGQFQNENSANAAIRRVHELPSVGEENPTIAQIPLEPSVLPGARLFAPGILSYLVRLYFAQHAVFPGSHK